MTDMETIVDNLVRMAPGDRPGAMSDFLRSYVAAVAAEERKSCADLARRKGAEYEKWAERHGLREHADTAAACYAIAREIEER